MNSPKISVIVLTYNQETTIERTLRSVEERCEGIDYEIIVGDDCSTDSTRAVALRAAGSNPRIRLMPASPNKGLVNNYFDCLATARGEYIADCAGDDTWLNEASIAEAAAMLDSDRRLSVVFSDVETVSGDGVLLREQGNPFGRDRIDGADVLTRLLNHVNSLPYALSAALYRRSVVQAALERNRQFVCMPESDIEDLPIIAALAAGGDAAYLPGKALRYFIMENSESNCMNPERQVRFYARSLECTRKLCEFYGVGQGEVADMFRAKAKYLAGMAYISRSCEMLDLVERALAPWTLRRPLSVSIRLAMLRATLIFRRAGR